MGYDFLIYYPICGHEIKFYMNTEQRQHGLMVDVNDSRKCADCMVENAQENVKKRHSRFRERKIRKERANIELKTWVAQDPGGGV